MRSLNNLLFTGILIIFGILIGGCAGEIATYHLAKEGSEAYNASDYSTALERWQAGLEQARNSENKKDISMFLYNIGLVYDKLSQYQQALDYYQEALEIRREIGDKRGQGNTFTNIGVVYQNLGQYQQALDYYQQALEMKRNAGDQYGEGGTLNKIGTVYWNLGQYQQALDYYQQALEIRRDADDKHGEGSTLNNIGGIYESQGQYQQALDYYQQALAIRRAIGDKSGEGSTLNNIGVVYWYLGQYPQALGYYQQALEIRRHIGDKRGEGYNLNNIGVTYWRLDKYQDALGYYQQALEIRREIGDKRGEGSTLNSMGELYRNWGQYQQALDYYQQALTIRRTIGDKRGEGSTLTFIGKVYCNLGQYQEAYNVFQSSIDINEMLGTIDILWMAQRGLAAVEVQLKQPDSAIIHYEQALDNIEALRAGLTEKEHKISFMEDKLYVYDELIDLLQTLHQTYPNKGYDRKALEIFERKQGRVFLEEMGKSGARLFAGLPESIKQQEEQLDTQHNQIRQHLANERAKTPQNHRRIQDLEQQKKTLQTEQEALQTEIKTNYPDYYALRYPQPADFSELQNNVLQPGELMLVYSVMKENTLLWVITPKTMQMYTLAVRKQVLQEKISEVREAMLSDWGTSRGLTLTDEPEGKQIPFVQASHDLYMLLIPENIQHLLTDQHILNIVPTGPLYALPFEALVNSPPGSAGVSPASETDKMSSLPGEKAGETPVLPGDSVHYLIEDIPVSYLSSASLLKTLREAKARRTTPARYPLLAFAHPVYSVDTPQDSDTVRGLRTQAYRELLGGGLPELPETAEEAETIAELFDAPEETNPVQLRWDASCINVFTFNADGRLDDYQYLLFAMHGVLPGEVSCLMQSALILSDNFLKMADVFGLQLNAKLVVLSACNTGRGEQVRGEGVMGLTRAFMYAGTPAIAVTLWSVESLSAKTLSIGMFRHLKEGATPAQALRAIKVRMLRGEEGQIYNHPYYWAPYVVFGDGM